MAPLRRLAVPLHQVVLDSEMIEHAAHDEIDEPLDGVARGVEAGRGGKDERAGVVQLHHVAERNARVGGLARHQDELAALLEADFGGPFEQVGRGARRDARQRAHRAGRNNHAVVAVGAARDRDLEFADVVIDDVVGRLAEIGADDGVAVLEIERRAEFVRENRRARLAYGEVDGGAGAGEALEEPPSVDGAGGA